MSSESCNFETQDGFKKCVYEYLCQCSTQCYGMQGDNKKTEFCSQITSGDRGIFQGYIIKVIDFFTKENLVKKIGIKYYITVPNEPVLKLSWENIKGIKDINTKTLFWLFRKLIVDSLLKVITSEMTDSQVQIYSVGSADISSDYDITLYGSSNSKKYIIEEFDIMFKELFGEASAVVFDTNIYGKAYISFDKDEFKGYTSRKAIKCDNQPEFRCLNTRGSRPSQLMWGIVKYLRDFREAFGEHMYNDYYNYLRKYTGKDKLLSISHKTLMTLKNKDPSNTNYVSLFDKEEEFLDMYSDDKRLDGIHDYISLVNFFGIETYFTYGAFVDTVVNSQMCPTRKIKLDEIDYIVSILENAGFFFTHNTKSKYMIRVINTFAQLDKERYPQQTFDKLVNVSKELAGITINGKVDYNTNYCKSWVPDDDAPIELMKCQKYDIFSLLMNLIKEILQTLILEHSNIFFYNKFIQKENTIFGRSYDVSSPSRL